MASKVNQAVTWMVGIANDDSHGYSQSSRWGPDYDCSSLVISAYEQAGIPVKSNGATYTGNMKSVFLATGFVDVTSSVNLATGAGMVEGDVLLNETHHTALYLDGGRLVQASINELGEVTGGQEGDQTGAEIHTRTYYNYPWNVVLRWPEQYVTKDQVISANRYLTLAEMKINASYIWQVLRDAGWSMNAVAGMLGNMQTESSINPGIWESLNEGNMSGGFGLVQWTPASKYFSWCDEMHLIGSDIDTALQRIEYELANNLQYYPTPDFPETFAEFKTSTKDPYYLGMAFLANYERPAEQNQPSRGTQADYWYGYLSTLVLPGLKERKGLPLWMMFMATRRRV